MTNGPRVCRHREDFSARCDLEQFQLTILVADGKGTLTFSTDRWTLGSGQPNDLLGHSLVVHEKVDDFVTQPTGNAGGRIGCAVLPAR